MLSTVALVLVFANPATAAKPPAQEGPQPTQSPMPRQMDQDKAQHRAESDDQPTDPWFDREYVATDDPAFILSAVENARQGVIEAREAAQHLANPQLRVAAEKIGAQNEATRRRLEKLAHTKGWRLPQPNPGRTTTVPDAAPVRANASFIINQIAYHQNTLAQYRAQMGGKGDAELKRALREALPGYQQNLDLLLKLKP